MYIIGVVKMSLLDKIIYVVDYIELGCDFLGVKEVCEIVFVDLDVVVVYEMKYILLYLIE